MPVIATISPTQSDAQAALGAFLTDLFAIPASSIVATQGNRVPEPKASNFIVMSVISFERQTTNNDQTNDVKMVGCSINSNVLTVSSVPIGEIVPGIQVLGPGVAAATFIQSQLSGPEGGAGTYQISVAQTLVGPVTLSAGSIQMTATFFMTIQLDFHSADYTAAQWAQTFAIAFRDNYAVTFFGNLPAPQNQITPLYAEDAKMRPFINDQKQYEWRWVVDAKLEIDQTVTVPQTFDDSVTIEVVEVP
jgi:hypothetical protein